MKFQPTLQTAVSTHVASKNQSAIYSWEVEQKIFLTAHSS